MDLKPQEGWSNLSIYSRFCVLDGHNSILEDFIFLTVKMTFQPLQHLLFTLRRITFLCGLFRFVVFIFYLMN